MDRSRIRIDVLGIILTGGLFHCAEAEGGSGQDEVTGEQEGNNNNRQINNNHEQGIVCTHFHPHPPTN